MRIYKVMNVSQESKDWVEASESSEGPTIIEHQHETSPKHTGTTHQDVSSALA